MEVVGRGFEAGDLGPGTIVGSAAFNMLMILAICVSIEGSKRVEQINVLYITASFSVFAYVWLYLIVSVISPGVIDVWEAVVTILYFPVLLAISWAADNGWIDKKNVTKPIRGIRKGLRRRLSSSYKLREEDDHQHTTAAVEHLVSVGHLSVSPQSSSVWHKKLKKTIRQVRKAKPELSTEEVYVEAFETLKGHHSAPRPMTNHLREINANLLNHRESETHFPADPSAVHVSDTLAMDITEFDLDGEDPSTLAKRFPDGLFTFAVSGVQHPKDEKVLNLEIVRRGPLDKDVTIAYETLGATAKPGTHFEASKGSLYFPASETQLMQTVSINITNTNVYDKNRYFSVLLSCNDEEIVWQYQECAVEIIDTYKFSGPMDYISSKVRKCCRQLVSDEEADSPYLEQIRVSYRFEEEEEEEEDQGDAPEEQGGRSAFDYFVYAFLVVWKVLFAIVIPPVDIWYGWLTFVTTLFFIGVLTAFVGDLATGIGCTVGLRDTVTAITFVALGTSVPDTFASKIAAEEDDTADPAIGNVTGSNAVNVFLGVGLAWLFGSVKHHIDGTQFTVEQGTIGFAVLVFSIFAVAWFAVLMIRRNWSAIGCELGGPVKYKRATAAFFVFLWLAYILLSALVSYDHIDTI